MVSCIWEDGSRETNADETLEWIDPTVVAVAWAGELHTVEIDKLRSVALTTEVEWIKLLPGATAHIRVWDRGYTNINRESVVVNDRDDCEGIILIREDVCG